MDKQYLDYLLSEWASYHYHTMIATIGYKKTSSTYRACKALEIGAVVVPTNVFTDKTPDYINQIDRALERLPDSYRQVIAVEYLGEGKRDDKANKLKITREYYSYRLSRAKSKLKTLLHKDVSENYPSLHC